MSEWGSDGGGAGDADPLDGAGSGSGGEREKVTYEPEYVAAEDENIYDETCTRGIDFDKYYNVKVNVTGHQVPASVSSFEECDLDPRLVANIKKSKWEKPTPIQQHAIPIISNKRDLMGCAQTGSGKTGAFMIPIINQLLKDGCEAESIDEGAIKPQCLVVAPTRELVQQIQRDCVKLVNDTPLKAQYAVGGHAVRHQLDKLQDGCNILIATPGRLNDFVGKLKVSMEEIKYVVLDEADRMLDMGFKPMLEELAQKMGEKEERSTLMFSATFPDDVQTLGKEFLKDDYLFCAVGIVGGASETVTQQIVDCEYKERFDRMKDDYLEAVKDSGEKTLIFVETKRNADYFASKLCQLGFPTTSIHGDRAQQEREEALNSFKTGKTPILVATNVAARGLDIPNVAQVINYEMPKEVDEYVHRIGRTGRCGNKGKAISFYCDEKDSEMGPKLVQILTNAQQEIPAFLQGMEVGGGGDNAPAAGDDDDDDDGW